MAAGVSTHKCAAGRTCAVGKERSQHGPLALRRAIAAAAVTATAGAARVATAAAKAAAALRRVQLLVPMYACAQTTGVHA
jgi:hypothetical protein